MPIQIVSKVVEWHSDVIAISTALIICIILTIITFRSMCQSKKTETLFKMLQIQIYVVFITVVLYLFVNLLRVISLPLSSKTYKVQQSICDIETTFFLILFGINNLSIDTLLISRLSSVFNNTQLALSKCIYYAYIISLSIYWSIWMLITGIMVTQNHSAPYNIYSESIDINGNATTCVATAQQSSKAHQLILPLAMIGIIFGNLIIWILFTRKLYILLNVTQQINSEMEMENAENQRETKIETFQMEFIDLMRDQTMLVSLMVFVTFFTFSISIIISFGQLLFSINYVNTLLTIFLSFKFNAYYFDLLRCNKFSRFCCKCFEKIITKKIGLTIDEIQIAKTTTDIAAQSTKLQSVRSKSTEKTATNQSVTEGIDGSSEINITSLEGNISTDTVDIINGSGNVKMPQLTPANSLCLNTLKLGDVATTESKKN